MGSCYRLYLYPLSNWIKHYLWRYETSQLCPWSTVNVGAYIAFAVSTAINVNSLLTSIGVGFYLSIIIAIVGVALMGVVLERLTFNRVRGKDKLTEIFLSLALISIFENVVILGRLRFTSNYKPLCRP